MSTDIPHWLHLVTRYLQPETSFSFEVYIYIYLCRCHLQENSPSHHLRANDTLLFNCHLNFLFSMYIHHMDKHTTCELCEYWAVENSVRYFMYVPLLLFLLFWLIVLSSGHLYPVPVLCSDLCLLSWLCLWIILWIWNKCICILYMILDWLMLLTGLSV